MEIKIKVEIGLTPAMEQALMSLARGISLSAGTSLPAGRSEEHKTEAAEAPAAVAAAEASASASAPAAVAAVAAAEASAPAGVVPPTDEEMRTLMDIAISRVAGNGWMDSKDPAVVRLRRGCTEQFKAIARHLGAEKPTTLQGDARTRFVAELDNIYVKNGADVEWLPF